MKVSFRYKSNKAVLEIKDKKVTLPISYVQYVFGNRELKPVPTIKK